jgi:hypothetical protein
MNILTYLKTEAEDCRRRHGVHKHHSKSYVAAVISLQLALLFSVTRNNLQIQAHGLQTPHATNLHQSPKSNKEHGHNVSVCSTNLSQSPHPVGEKKVPEGEDGGGVTSLASSTYRDRQIRCFPQSL